MKTLHILNKSPKAPYPADQCARLLAENDSILLIEDAVYYALPPAYTKLAHSDNNCADTPIFALKEDIDARGISKLIDNNIQVVSYSGFVDLTASHDKSTSWY